jgi:hypothetical protein
MARTRLLDWPVPRTKVTRAMSHMHSLVPPVDNLEPQTAAQVLADWGFLASPDLPDRPGPARLLVAIRSVPTLRHFDPERVEFWVSEEGRGRPATISYATTMPLERDFSWGLIRITDRLHVSNEYLTFGGRMGADSIDGTVVVVFTSPAPLLRRGGHSQPWDPPAEWMAAFFARIMVAVDYAAGFEALVASADPLVRYAAFVEDCTARFRSSGARRLDQPGMWTLMESEERRLQRDHPEAWDAGDRLLTAARVAA